MHTHASIGILHPPQNNDDSSEKLTDFVSSLLAASYVNILVHKRQVAFYLFYIFIVKLWGRREIDTQESSYKLLWHIDTL